MRWLCLAAMLWGCGSGEPASGGAPSDPTPTSPAAPSEAASSETTTAPADEAPAPTPAEPAPAPDPGPSEPTEVPEELRESHDRLLARIEANPNDVPSICALASVLRRAEMFSAAEARLDEAERIGNDESIPLELPDGSLQACQYERGRVREARGDWPMARASYWGAMTTPIERRRRIVREAFLRVAKREAEEDCDSLGALALRGFLTLEDAPVFRRCLRERERAEPPCEVLWRDDPYYPGTRERDFDSYAAVVGDDGAAFGILGDELHVISVVRGRRQVRRCSFDLADDSRISFPRALTLGDESLFYVTTTSILSYTCECEEGEEGPEQSPHDCRCEDAFDVCFLFTDRGELRLALIEDYSTDDGMPGVRWDEPHLREAMSDGPTVEGEVLRLGRRLRLRNRVLVPAD